MLASKSQLYAFILEHIFIFQNSKRQIRSKFWKSAINKDQHSQFFFLLSRILLTLILLSEIVEKGFTHIYFLSFIYLVSSVKASCTLRPFLELTSKNCIPYFLAIAFPYQYVTCLSSCKSALVATRILQTSSDELDQICLIQEITLLQDLLSAMEYARMMPAAPLQQVCVMFRNLYCPAVSQICSFTFFSSIVSIFILKSTPMVATQLYLKRPSQKYVSKLVLPTPLSPTIMTLNSRSETTPRLVLDMVFDFLI